MECTLYTFRKKHNSTKIPDNGTLYYCLLKDSCGVINPTFMFSFTDDFNPTTYNYAYIKEFSRYYFINDWMYESGIWYAIMTCDVLASWKNEIGASKQYILRSAAAYNESVLDTLYPVTGVTTSYRNSVTTPFTYLLDNGTYIISIINNDSNKVGMTTYYKMTQAQFQSFCEGLYNNLGWAEIDADALDNQVAKALIDPMQYITSCRWYPFQISGGMAVTSIPFGYWSLAISATKITSSAMWRQLGDTSLHIRIPKHPQSAVRGEYLNLEPFTRYMLYFPAFGEIAIDATKLYDMDFITIPIYYDLVTGRGFISISAHNDSDTAYNIIAQRLESKIAIDMDIAQLTTNIEQAANGLGNLVGGVASLITGNIGTGLAQITSGITSASLSAYPQVTRLGGQEGLATYVGDPALVGCFMTVVAEDNDNLGRPLCAIGKISDYPGYLLISHAEISPPCTKQENDTIITYLESGFVYE